MAGALDIEHGFITDAMTVPGMVKHICEHRNTQIGGQPVPFITTKEWRRIVQWIGERDGLGDGIAYIDEDHNLQEHTHYDQETRTSERQHTEDKLRAEINSLKLMLASCARIVGKFAEYIEGVRS